MRGLSGTLRESRSLRADTPPALASWLKPVVSLLVSSPEVPIGDESKPVRAQIDRELGLSRPWRVVIVGAGNLGRALVSYRGFESRGFEIVGLGRERRNPGSSRVRT